MNEPATHLALGPQAGTPGTPEYSEFVALRERVIALQANTGQRITNYAAHNIQGTDTVALSVRVSAHLDIVYGDLNGNPPTAYTGPNTRLNIELQIQELIAQRFDEIDRMILEQQAQQAQAHMTGTALPSERRTNGGLILPGR